MHLLQDNSAIIFSCQTSYTPASLPRKKIFTVMHLCIIEKPTLKDGYMGSDRGI